MIQQRYTYIAGMGFRLLKTGETIAYGDVRRCGDRFIAVETATINAKVSIADYIWRPDITDNKNDDKPYCEVKENDVIEAEIITEPAVVLPNDKYKDLKCVVIDIQ